MLKKLEEIVNSITTSGRHTSNRVSKKLEGIVNSITLAEDRAVNFFVKSDFVTKHPVAASVDVGAGLAIVLSSIPWLVDYSLSPPVFVGMVFASSFLASSLIYMNTWHRHGVHKHGLNVKLFDEFDKQSTIYQPPSGKFPRNIIDKILTHPRTVAASLSAALFAHNSYKTYDADAGFNYYLAFFTMASLAYLPFRRIASAMRFFAHSNSDKGLPEAILGGITGFLGDKFEIKSVKSFAMNRAEKAVQKNPGNSSVIADLADRYFRSGRTLEGLLEMKRSLDESKMVLPRLIATGRSLMLSTSLYLNAVSKGTAGPFHYISLVRILSTVGDKANAMRFFDEYSEKFRGIHNDINRALLLQSIGEGERAPLFWRRAIDAIYSQESLRILPTGEGIHFSGRFDADEMLASTLFAKRVMPKEANYEARLIAEVSRRNVNPAYNMPQVVGSVPYGDNVDLILKYIKGTTLAGLEANDAAYGKTIDSLVFTSWFHRNMPPEFSEVGRVDMQSKFRQISERLGFSAPFPNTICSLISDLEADDVLVLAKDGHPYQFIIGSDSIAPVDYDDKGVDLLSRDVAKALVHPDLPVAKVRLPQLVSDAARISREEGLAGDSQKAELNLLKGMLIQPLSFCDAWSAPQLSHMQGRRAGSVERAFVALDIMRQNYGVYFASNQANLTTISDGYRALEELLKTHAS